MRERVRYLFLPREHKIHIFELTCNVLLLYKSNDDGVFDDFPKISDHFFEDFQNCFKGQTNVPEHIPKISENFRRCPKIAEDFRGRPEDVLMIHQDKLDISEIIDIFTCEDIISYRFY